MDFHFTGPYGVELVGYAAAAASLYAANSKTIIPLRFAAIVANILAMAYSYNHGTIPSVLLNAVLLPINTLRLRAMWKLIRDVDVAGKGDMNVKWLLDYMRPKQFKAGDLLVERGAIANEAFYVISGEVEIVEIQRTVGSGALVGEMGLFTRRRPAHHDGALRRPTCRRRPSPTTGSRNSISRTRSSASTCCGWSLRACTATECSSPPPVPLPG